MKETKYKVWFEDGQGIETHSVSVSGAIIKAQYARMQKGESIAVESVLDPERGTYWEVNHEIKRMP